MDALVWLNLCMINDKDAIKQLKYDGALPASIIMTKNTGSMAGNRGTAGSIPLSASVLMAGTSLCVTRDRTHNKCSSLPSV